MQSLLLTLRKYAVIPLSPHSYSHIGDVIVIGLTILMFVLLFQTYIHRSKHFRLLMSILISSFCTSASNVVFQLLLDAPHSNIMVIYGIRLFHNIAMITAMYLYLRYLQDLLWIREKVKRRSRIQAQCTLAAAIVVDVLGTIFHYGYFIADDGTIFSRLNIFITLYALYTIAAFCMIIYYRSRLINPVFWGLLGSNIVGLIILFVQGLFGEISYTGIAYFFPLLGIIFMFHSNPYDVETGAVSEQFFYEELSEAMEKNRTMVMISCSMQNFFAILKSSKDPRYEYYKFFRENIQRGIVYRFADDRLVFTFAKRYDTAQDRTIEKMLDDFKDTYSKFNIDYKVVIMETTPDIERGEEYIRLIQFAESIMQNNSIHRITDNDVNQFYGSSYILSEMEDIARRKDLDDERVLVFCQPVFNIQTGIYDTAEALMRLKLERTGMVFPDQFISLAEQNGLIHAMSMIILNKTCGAVRTLMEDGYEINRVSVNFSTMDLRYESFCQDVQQIILRNQIPFEKIAIEITESRSEADFNIMKQKVTQLQELGIKFYLDDFGTGYSNFERIMAIPFDIIKFDRSLLIESGKNENSFYMVNTFANMFDNLHYSVLFEGIETDFDETNCVQMKAKYLQGFKYSRPIPIEQLVKFLPAKN